MAFIEWNEDIRVGVEAIDEQHQKLFDILNALHDSVAQGKEQSDLRTIMDELIEYTVYHFATEEKFFEQCEFPGLDEHRTAHNALTSQAVELQRQFDEGSATISFELLDFLHSWLQGHTSGLDKDFGAYITANHITF